MSPETFQIFDAIIQTSPRKNSFLVCLYRIFSLTGTKTLKEVEYVGYGHIVHLG